MERILIFIKHHFELLWKLIEYFNDRLFSLFYKSEMEQVLSVLSKELVLPSFSYKRLDIMDAISLFQFIQKQKIADLKYFSPHGFDLISIQSQFKYSSFLMMGVFDKENLVGYFFLRFFANRKCFVGRLIDIEYRGKGIGIAMNNIMYEIAWRMRFRCLSTISRNNELIMKAHAKNPKMIVLKELLNNYILVEFVR
jgi:hypothetical protein